YIGWFNDYNYRVFVFRLEHNADFMTWAYKKNYGDSNFTTMLSWHKTGDKDYKGFSFSDEVTFKWKTTFIGNIQFRNLGSIESFSNLIEWGTGRNNRSIVQFESGQVQFHMGSSTPRHAFFTDGTKSGGSIEIKEEVLGMSPIDSPQILIEYIEFDVELTADGTIVYLDADYLLSVDNFAVFLNNGVVVEKGIDYFVVTGEGLAYARIVGKRVDYEQAFWGDMKSLEKPQDANKPQMRMMNLDDRVKGFWRKQKTRQVTQKEVNGKTMQQVYRGRGR